jgi:hypothetical protein
MDKQKQLEEMAKIIHKHFQYLKSDWEEYTKSDLSLAYALQWNGYRKIPEGAVVLTREEYNGFKIIAEKQSEIIDETEKKTAEKFAKESKQRLKDKLHRGKALHTTVFGKEYVRRIFKEVIDEVCKEITEGK